MSRYRIQFSSNFYMIQREGVLGNWLYTESSIYSSNFNLYSTHEAALAGMKIIMEQDREWNLKILREKEINEKLALEIYE